jgi:hypothetical protein
MGSLKDQLHPSVEASAESRALYRSTLNLKARKSVAYCEAKPLPDLDESGSSVTQNVKVNQVFVY